MRFSFIFAFAICALAFSGPAFADTTVYKDADFKFTASFPDTWRTQIPDTPTTRLRVAGPPAEDMATCRIKAEKDGRLEIYPKRHMEAGVRQVLDEKFWDHEMNQYDKALMADYLAPAGLGQGDATGARVTYWQPDPDGKPVAMQALMLGTIYGDTRFVMSCASKADAYPRWAKLFGSVIGSVEFENRYHPFAIGYYRNFLMDETYKPPRLKPGTEVR